MTKPRRFAEGTTVDAGKSRGEIDTYLTRRGATEFGFSVTPDLFGIQFRIRQRAVRFVIARPKGGPPQKREAEERRIWRALLLVLRAKFEAVDSGITTFDHEFLAHLVTAQGATVGDAVAPQLERVLAGEGAPLALGPGSAS